MEADVDAYSSEELSELTALLGPDFMGRFESFEALVKYAGALLPRTMLFDRVPKADAFESPQSLDT